MRYQTFSNLQLRKLLKKSFHSIHLDLRDTSEGNLPLVSVCITPPVLMFKKASITFSNLQDFKTWLLQDKNRFHFTEVMVDNLDGDSVHLHKLW